MLVAMATGRGGPAGAAAGERGAGLAALWRLPRLALAGLFDQSRPFGRLALVHTLQAAGTSLITVSLAGSLFFSISPKAAESKVVLYLLLTIAPFALVGPALSPLLDLGRQARRTSVAVANAASAVLCLGMARNVHDLLLFPEAFGVLVLGKLYLVARAALVPDVAAGEELASANARLAVLASLASAVVAPVGVGILRLGGPSWVLRVGAIVFLGGALASLRLARPGARRAPVEPPARASTEAPPPAGLPGGRLRLSFVRGDLLAAVSAMSVARASVGFVAFFLAFALRRAHAAPWWYGVLLVASGAGSLVGSMAVPRLRRYWSPRQIIVAALVAIALGALVAAVLGGRWAQAFLTFVVGLGPMSAKPALDSIVQTRVPGALLGRVFGRIETRLQLVWVLASLLGVVIPFSLLAGDVVVAAAGALGALSYASARPAPRSATPAPTTGA